MLGLNQGPGPMMDLVGFAAFKSVAVAIKLGIFEVLASGPLTAAETAHRIEADERATALLLKFLEALGYVKEHNNRYSNTAMTVRWILSSSQNSIAGLFAHWEQVQEVWEHLEESIRRGEPAMPVREWVGQQPGGWQRYQDGMVAISHAITDKIITRVKLKPNVRRLLDVGGGHGLYSIEFCRNYEGLSATIFDLPEVREMAVKNIATQKMEGRVIFQDGNFQTDDLGNGYDVALVFNIIHGFLPEKNTELFRRVASALNPRGLIVIMDQIPGKVVTPTARIVVGLMGLSQFISTGGQTYTFHEITDWLRIAGFTKNRFLSLSRSPGFGLVIGTKTC